MLAWLVAFLAGGFAASHLSSRLSYDFSLPGQPSYETSVKILRLFGNGGTSTPSIAVVTVPSGENVRAEESRLTSAFESVRRSHPDVRLVDYSVTHDARYITNDGRSTFAYVFRRRTRASAQTG